MKLLSVLLLAGIWLPLISGAQTITRNCEGVGPACPSKSGVIRWPSEGTFYIEDCATGKTIVEAVFPKPDPMEVPAIRSKDVTLMEVFVSPGGWRTGAAPNCDGQWYNVTPTYSECRVESWTCADKSRILEHSEENPPKYWCRKVKTE